MTYDCAYTEWGDRDSPKPARDYYRIAWRSMAANTGERTLISCNYSARRGTCPPGVVSMGLAAKPDLRLPWIAAVLSSLVL